MNTWIALLRGINVGGHGRLPMADLRALLEECGFAKVQTYIQSGNIVCQSQLSDAAAVAEEIATAIDERFGFRRPVLVLTPEELTRAIAANPYPETEEPKQVHFFFLAQPAPDTSLDALTALARASEQFHLTDLAFYLHTPEGIGRSKLAAAVEKHIPVDITARNLRTVLAIAEMAKP